MSKTTRITVGEWQAELNRLARVADPDGMSSAEVADILGVHRQTALGIIRAGIDAGRVACVGRRMTTRIDGVRVPITPVYSFITKETEQ